MHKQLKVSCVYFSAVLVFCWCRSSLSEFEFWSWQPTIVALPHFFVLLLPCCCCCYMHEAMGEFVILVVITQILRRFLYVSSIRSTLYFIRKCCNLLTFTSLNIYGYTMTQLLLLYSRAFFSIYLVELIYNTPISLLVDLFFYLHHHT
jgi:hypothetical protein